MKTSVGLKDVQSQIIRVFQNLIDNSIKFRSPRNLQIDISAEKDNHTWTFRVSDNGTGIHEDDLEKVFMIFHRGRDAAAEGTGIGLAVSQRIIERHGGRIWVESKFGQGTEFYFTLPGA